MICFVVGTRPEVLKLSPVWRHLPDAKIVAARQHTDLLDQHLDRQPATEILDVERLGDSVSVLTGGLLSRLGAALRQLRPRIVVVQGDTATAVAGALAAFYEQVPCIAHVEAGLRSHNLAGPFPEEANRCLISQVATHNFAPTPAAAAELRRTWAPGKVFVTGNTSIDRLYEDLAEPRPPVADEILCGSKRPLVITCHRREGRAERVAELGRALGQLEGWDPIWVAHPAVDRSASNGVRVTPPVDHRTMVHLIAAADAVMTDSGGVIEEAVTLGKPTLILRNETERHEAVEAGRAVLVRPSQIVEKLAAIDTWARTLDRCAIFGDGHAGRQIAAYLAVLDAT